MENNPALPSGKTSPARSAATKAQTSRSSCLNCAASQNQKPPLLLSLKAAGQTPDASLTWAAAALPGEPLTLNFTEYPNAAVGSSLSAILQDNVPDSYSLSPAACRGILRRAFVRGKPLPEPCLLAVKGKPKRASNAVSQLIMSPIREHSRKPDEVRDRIVELLGDLPRIELFAREAAPGWDCWGKEAPINGVFRYDD